jgi:hypothetical protein
VLEGEGVDDKGIGGGELVSEDEVLFVRGEIGILWGAGDVGHGVGHEAGEGELFGSVVGAVHFDEYGRVGLWDGCGCLKKCRLCDGGWMMVVVIVMGLLGLYIYI